jgi:2',3'-cyclic-nucleotide 2'-phosphodiesterase/3'-nucleotidase
MSGSFGGNYFVVRNLTILAIILTLSLGGLLLHDHYSIPTRNLVIFYTSNLRGQIKPFSGTVLDRYYDKVGGLAFIKGFIEDSSKKYGFSLETSLLVDTGDALFGSAESALTMGEVPLSLMGKAGYDAMAIGNLEFEYGFSQLKKFIKDNHLQMLACNYRDVTSPVGKTFKPGVIVEKGGIKIGIVGLGHGDLARNTREDNIVNIEVSEMRASVNKTAAELKSKGAEIIVLLSHHPQLDSLEAPDVAFPDVDIIIGDLIGPISVLKSRPLICQTASNRGGGIGMIKIPFVGGKWALDQAFKRVFPVDSSKIPPDEELVSEISKVESKVDSLLEEVITTSTGNFQRSFNDESPLGNLIVDSMREITKCDIAFQNSGGIKASLDKGPVSLRDLYDMLPFENNIVTLQLKGWQIENLIEEGLSAKSGFIQTSGINCTYSSTNPKGFRVIQIDVNDEPLEFNKDYSVAINDFMANNHYDWPELNLGKKKNVFGPLRENLEKLFRQKKEISPLAEKHFNDFEEMDETLRVQALSFDLASLTTSVSHNGKIDSTYGQLVAEILRKETSSDFAFIPVSLLNRNREKLTTITPARIISDFVTDEGVLTVKLTGEEIERILVAGISSDSAPICFSGFSLELRDKGKFKIFPWEGIFEANNIYKVALNENFPRKIEGFYDFSTKQYKKYYNDIRRSFINGIRQRNGQVEVKRALY